jgi:hypothetical protein
MQMAPKDPRVDQLRRPRRYVSADVLFPTPHDVVSEIVVDWQLPSDMDNRRRA